MGPPSLTDPQPTDHPTPQKNSPLNPSHTNTESRMTTLVPALTSLNHKVPMVPSQVNTVQPFPMAVPKLLPIRLTTTVDSSLMSNTKAHLSTPLHPQADMGHTNLPAHKLPQKFISLRCYLFHDVVKKKMKYSCDSSKS